MYNVNMMYVRGPNNVMCKLCILKIINKMCCWLQTDVNEDMGAKFPQERGCQRENYSCLLNPNYLSKLFYYKHFISFLSVLKPNH
jgi:hypothetical protein